MKNKYLKIVTAFAVLSAFALTLSSCSLGFGNFVSRNPYEIATDLGYTDSNGAWLAGNTAPSTEARRMYEEAKADGYEGSYVDFLKEIGYSHDETGAVNRALMSTVTVVCDFQMNAKTEIGGSLFDNGIQNYSSMGSGVIYSLDKANGNAYIVTNYHVVYSNYSLGKESIAHISDDITLYLYGGEITGREIPATYVGGTMEYDIAVLRVENSEVLKDSSAMAIRAGDSDALTVGDRVYAIGNADAEGMTVTSGIISVDAEHIDIELADGKSTTSMLVLRTDAPINHGNSGGGLYDSSGRLVGIVNARSEASGVLAFGYAIPVNLAVSVAQNIIDNSKLNDSKGAMRAMLGISVQTTDTRSVFDEDTDRAYVMETVTVVEVNYGGAAHGKLKAGDVLYSVQIGDGKPQKITRMFMLTNTLFNVRKGDTVTIVVARGDETVTVGIEYDSSSMFTLYN